MHILKQASRAGTTFCTYFPIPELGCPHTLTKTMKTALRPQNFDERNGNVVKMEKCAICKFILRLDYVPARFSLRLARSH